jgi:hypothetical protein
MVIVDGLLVGFEKTPQLKEVGSDLRRAGEKLVKDGIRFGVLPPAEEAGEVCRDSGSEEISLDSSHKNSAITRSTKAFTAKWSQKLSRPISSMFRGAKSAMDFLSYSVMEPSVHTTEAGLSSGSERSTNQELGMPVTDSSHVYSRLREPLLVAKTSTMGTSKSSGLSPGTQDVKRGPGS